MKNLTARLIDAAAEAFPMHGPVYEFGFSATSEARQTSLDEHNPSAATETPARIDRLGDLDRLPFPDGAARTVVCENSLQYTFEPCKAIAEMSRILSPGGLLVAVESTRPAHSGVGDRYWNVHPSAMGRLFEGFSGTLSGWIGHDAAPHTVFAIGCKAPMPAEFPQGVQPFLDRLGRSLEESTQRIGTFRSIKRWLVEWMCSPDEQRAWRDDHRVQYALHLGVDEQSRPAILQSCLAPSKTGTRLDLSE